MSFVHLHVHSNMSILDAMPDPVDLAMRAGALEMPALALTDHGNVHAMPDFVRGCNAAGVKPIIGCEFYQVQNATQRTHVLVPDIPDSTARRRHITVLCENKTGWKNMIALQNWAFEDGFYYKPRIDLERLIEFGEGIIVLSGCISSELTQTAGNFEYKDALALAEKYARYFGDAYYLEITALDRNEFRQKAFTTIVRIHEETGIPLVVTGDVHYIEPKNAKIHAIMTRMGNKKGYECEELWLKNRDDVWDTFVREWKGTGLKQKTILTAMDRTLEIAERVEQFTIEPEHSIGAIHLAG